MLAVKHPGEADRESASEPGKRLSFRHLPAGSDLEYTEPGRLIRFQMERGIGGDD